LSSKPADGRRLPRRARRSSPRSHRSSISRRPIPRVRRWFDDFLARYCEVLDVNTATAILAGTLRGQLAARGRIRTQADMLIAATAAHHGLTLVTRNVRDFEECGVTVVDPFTEK